MSIDTRLAKGLAANSIWEMVVEGTALFTVIKNEVGKVKVVPATAKGARKLTTWIRACVSACSLMTALSEKRSEGPSLSFLFFRPDTDRDNGDFLLSHCKYTPQAAPHNRLLFKNLVYFSKHSLARSHQRLNKMGWEETKEEFSAAIITLWLLEQAKIRLPNLTQALLPSKDGFFVGLFREEGEIAIDTYIKFESNGSLRWTRAYDLYSRLVEQVVVNNVDVRCLTNSTLIGDTYGLEVIVDWFVAELQKPEFAWLMEPYETRPDPIGDTWVAARAQAESGGMIN
jgi:hypothetical protein